MTWKEHYLTLLREQRETQRRLEQIKYFDEVERPKLFASNKDLYHMYLRFGDLEEFTNYARENKQANLFYQSEVFWYDKIHYDISSINHNPYYILDKPINLNQLILDKPLNISWREYYIQLINEIPSLKSKVCPRG